MARDKWLTASVEHDTTSVITAVFDEATRRDPGHRRDWLALVDGNAHQIDVIHDQARQRAVKVTIMLDFVHVLEYLWKAAWYFYKESDKAAEQWVAEHARRVLAGRSGTAAAAIRRKATYRGLRPDQRKTPTPPRITCYATVPTSTTPTPWNRAGPSPPASSRAPAATSSRTAWTSPVPAGAWPEPRPYSNSVP